jgi:iron complex transport system substrate-binding protein
VPIDRPLVARSLGLIAAIAAVTLTVATGCGEPQDGSAASPTQGSLVTSTTRIASAGVLGNQRRPDESCAAEPAAVDPGPPDREVRHAAGTTNVQADPQRIAVLSADQLDTLCALGLQSRVVVAAVADGAAGQPSYLGSVLHDVPPAGSETAPDLTAIRAAAPDLILGSEASPTSFAALSDIAPTVFTGPAGADWRGDVRTVGAATGRDEAVTGLLDGFAAAARKTGADNDATHFQASVVQLTDNALRVYGADNFPGSVLAEVGLDRPAAQRFTDKPYAEISTTDLSSSTDFSIADGDVVYVSFASAAARKRAPEVLDSAAWRELSANRDGRVYAVNNEVWQTGQGIVAARGILDDLRYVNAPIN